MRWRCEKCDGSNVQSREWVHLNGGTMVEDDDLLLIDLWCPDCDADWDEAGQPFVSVVCKEEDE